MADALSAIAIIQKDSGFFQHEIRRFENILLEVPSFSYEDKGN
jgi:hypothetical protein